MSNTKDQPRGRILDPIERVSEILFGLIMALTFTCTLSAATAQQEDIRTMMVGAIGCNIAWGLVDAVMYLVTRLTTQGRNLRTLRFVRETQQTLEADEAITDALPPVVASVLDAEEIAKIRKRLSELPSLPPHARLSGRDWLGAVAVWLLVCLSTFPVVIPFIFVQDPMVAIRVSNGIAVVMMFLCGYKLGVYANHRAWRMGIGMAILGSVLVALTIMLGG